MPRPRKTGNGTGTTNGSRYFTQQGLNNYVKSICDVLRRSNVAGAMNYVPELTWLLFLRILDEREQIEADNAEAVGARFTPSLDAPYRWQDWAAPGGPKRVELAERGALGAFFGFVNGDLIPHLKGLRDRPNAGPRQKVIGEIMNGIDHTRIDTEKNMLDVLDMVDKITMASIDPTHVFPISQVYEGLLLKMGEKGNDGGQFFTPREIIRAMVKVIDPKPGETVYDPGCGTGGFLAQAYLHESESLGDGATADQLEALKRGTFYGREKENLIYPIALANLVLHGIDEPKLWHGNTLTMQETYGGLFEGAPSSFDVVLTNPPFGGKENADAQINFAYKTSATQVLFLQHVMDSLKPGGRCGMVVDEGVLFRTNERAFVQTKQKLLNELDLYCIVSLPGGVFTAAGAGVKTNLLFFRKPSGSEPTTQAVWYYDLSDIKVGKRTPFTLDKFDDFFRLLPERGDSERSWTVPVDALREKGYDLKAVNPNAKVEEDNRTPEQLLDEIEARGREVAEIIAQLRRTL